MTTHRNMAIKGLIRDTSGLAAVELALILPILLVLLAGVIDYSRLASQRMQVRSAAQAGADHVLRQGWNATAVENAITGSTALAVSADPVPRLIKACMSGTDLVETSSDSCPSGEKPGSYVTTAALAAFEPLMPWPGIVLPNSIQGAAFTRIE